MLSDWLIHFDETRLQVLRGTRHRRLTTGSGAHQVGALFYSTTMPRVLALSRGGGILVTDGYEAYDAAARVLNLVHAGCFAHVRRKFEEARKGAAFDKQR